MKTASILAVAAGAALAYASPAEVEARATATASPSSGSATGSSTLPTVTTKGNAFFVGDERFYIRGIDYQPGGSSQAADPLADYSVCSRDIPYFKQLGMNTVRVYTIDNTANHDQCMALLAENGIYLALDVNTPNYSLNRADPGPSYNPTYLQSIFATIDAFQGYSNTLLFFSGNEVINAINTTNTAPYVKAVTRDMRQYIGTRGYRPIPVGYSAADVSENQYLMAQYMDCGDAPSRSDFYAINNYEWCYPSSFTQSGWNVIAQTYANYSVPVFFSEYGCITNGRDFEETAALYNEDMTGSFSGGCVYEYSQEGNNYGIVTISGSTVTPVGSQFTDLKNALASVADPSNGGNYSTSGVVQNCPDQGEYWNTAPFTGSALPAMPDGAAQYMKNGAGTGPGLSGSGSQNAGGASTGTASAGAGSVSATYGPGATATGSSGNGTTHHSGASAIGRFDTAPMICGLVVMVSMMAGALAL